DVCRLGLASSCEYQGFEARDRSVSLPEGRGVTKSKDGTGRKQGASALPLGDQRELEVSGHLRLPSVKFQAAQRGIIVLGQGSPPTRRMPVSHDRPLESSRSLLALGFVERGATVDHDAPPKRESRER